VNTKNNILKILMGIFGFVVLYSVCSGPKQQRADYYDVNVQTVTAASEGLDLKAVGELVKKSQDAEELEKRLNSKNEGLNNLDLNEDGKVDYISVTEYGNKAAKGLSLTVEPAPGETQEIATIEIEKVSDSKANMEVRGNEQIYGRHHYHRSGFGLGEILILGYLLRPHSFYSSPWSYGNYPRSYSPYSTVSNNSYRGNVNSKTRGSKFRSASSSTIKSTTYSRNSGKSARSIRAPLKNPTSSQKSFQTRNPSKQIGKGGFGRSRSTSRPSVRRSASRRSGGFSRGK